MVSQMWASAWKKNYSYHICEIYPDFGKLAFCLANHACVSHLLRGQPHLLECYYQNCLIGTHVCTSSIRMISFFTLQCQLFTSCNVSNNASLVCARTGGGGGEGGGQPNVDRPGRGGGGGSPKNSQICADILYG